MAEQEAREQAALEEAAREQEAQEQASRARLDSVREVLREADIIGLRLGMSLAEAEKLLSEKIDVGWIAEPDDEKKQSIIARRGPNQPYQTLRTYISSDGTQQIALYYTPDQGERVVAIARSILIPHETPRELVAKKLKEKYGDQPISSDQDGRNSFVWTADFGEVPSQLSQSDDATRYSRGTCVTGVQSGWSPSSLKVLEDSPSPKITGRIAARTPILLVRGGSTLKQGTTNERSWDTAKWRDCGPTVVADMSGHNLGTVLLVGLFDLAAYAEHYQQGVGSAETTVSLPDL